MKVCYIANCTATNLSPLIFLTDRPPFPERYVCDGHSTGTEKCYALIKRKGSAKSWWLTESGILEN